MDLTRRGIIGAGLGAGALVVSPWEAGAQDAEIRIGSLCPITRAGSPFGPGMQKGIEYAVADVNAAGGVLGGRKLRLFSEDSQSDPDAAIRAAKKLIDVNGVQTLLGTWSSSVTMAIAPIAMQNKIVNMNTSSTTDLRSMKKDEYVWQCLGSTITYGKMMGEYAVQQGYKKAAFLAFNNPSGITLGDEFKKRFEAAGGTCTVTVYNANQTSYKAELARALSTKPDVIALGSYLPDTTILLKEWYALGETTRWVGPNWAVSPALLQAVGPDAAEGIVSIGALARSDTPAYEAFRARFERDMKQNVLDNPFGAVGYDMGIVCALAIEAAKSPVAEEFRRQIRAVTGPEGRKVYLVKDALEAIRAGERINYEGVSGSMDFDETGETRPDFAYWVAEKGKLQLKERLPA